jgi:exonuclease III
MLQNMLSTLDTEFDILILSETWLKPHNVEIYSIEGYSHEYVIRNKKAGGGLSIFIKNNIQYNLREDLKVNTDDIEMIWLEIKKENNFFDKNLVIGGMNRRPGVNPDIFIDTLSEKLHIIKHQNKNCIYAGDFNLDLLNINHTPRQTIS